TTPLTLRFIRSSTASPAPLSKSVSTTLQQCLGTLPLALLLMASILRDSFKVVASLTRSVLESRTTSLSVTVKAMETAALVKARRAPSVTRTVNIQTLRRPLLLLLVTVSVLVLVLLPRLLAPNRPTLARLEATTARRSHSTLPTPQTPLLVVQTPFLSNLLHPPLLKLLPKPLSLRRLTSTQTRISSALNHRNMPLRKTRLNALLSTTRAIPSTTPALAASVLDRPGH
ncbi:hypothetical protein BC629DRAFT_1473732, partial [Irpex lacteus]